MGTSNKQQTIESWDFNIILESGELKENQEYWQKQCNILYRNILKDLPAGSIQPLKSKSIKGEKGDIVTIFSILNAAGITKIAFNRMFKIIKIWLENRPKTRVSIQYHDGSTIELTGLTNSEALKLIETHHIQSKNVSEISP